MYTREQLTNRVHGADVRARIVIEMRIVRRVVADLLRDGWEITVNDSECDTVHNSVDFQTVIRAMMTSDEDILKVRKPGAGHHYVTGWIRFVYGNDGWDVLSDYSARRLDSIMGPIGDYAESVDVLAGPAFDDDAPEVTSGVLALPAPAPSAVPVSAFRDRCMVATLVRALHVANTQGRRGNTYAVYHDELKAAAIMLGQTDAGLFDDLQWADRVGPDCEA